MMNQELIASGSIHPPDSLFRLANHEVYVITARHAGLALLEGTSGWSECRVMDRLDGGDRVILLADVVAGDVHPGRLPLRRQEAFERLPPDLRRALVQRRLDEGVRDRELIRKQ